MVESLRKGDQIVTAGGLIGKVIKVKEGGIVEVELGENVRVKVRQGTISDVINKTEPTT